MQQPSSYSISLALSRRALELEPELDDAIDALQKAEELSSEAACVCTLEGHSGQVHDISTIEVSYLVVWHYLSHDCRQLSVHATALLCAASSLRSHANMQDSITTMQSGDKELIVSASADTSVRLVSSSSHHDGPAEQQKLPHKDQVPSSAYQ